MLKDKSKAAGLFTSDFSIEEVDNLSKKQKRVTPFQRKLEEGLFNDFTYSDWKKYFEHKAKEHGIAKFYHGNPNNERSILQSLMKEFTALQIKDMIDFLWDADHSLVAHKGLVGISMLSSGWRQTLVTLIPIWKNEGTVNPKKADRPLIESDWTKGKEEESRPIKKKKSKISI